MCAPRMSWRRAAVAEGWRGITLSAETKPSLGIHTPGENTHTHTHNSACGGERPRGPIHTQTPLCTRDHTHATTPRHPTHTPTPPPPPPPPHPPPPHTPVRGEEQPQEPKYTQTHTC